jgi:[histone H3]-trimethyl-L-lysine4 demethylase
VQVNKAKKWIDVSRALGYIGVPAIPGQLRSAYTRIILPYEDFCERGRNTPISPPRGSHNKSQVNGTPGNPSNTMGDVSAPSSPLTTSSSPLSEPPDESELKEQVANAKPRRSTRRMSQGWFYITHT